MPRRNGEKVRTPTQPSKVTQSLPASSRPSGLGPPLTETDVGQSLDSAAAQQLELELCWCIQQLQGALTSSKMNSKQSSDALRSLNVLKNNSAPLVKKRQLMRSTFGDYRSKMAEEEKKFKKAKPHMILDTPSPNKNSRFLKQSAFKSTVTKFSALEPSDNSFRFNFSQSTVASEETEDVTRNERGMPEHTGTPIKIKNNCENNESESGLNLKHFKYNLSDNSFRFNFHVEDSLKEN